MHFRNTVKEETRCGADYKRADTTQHNTTQHNTTQHNTTRDEFDVDCADCLKLMEGQRKLIHYAREDWKVSLCYVFIGNIKLTDKPSEVTCPNCIKQMG